MVKHLIFVLLLLSLSSCYAQGNMKNYEGNWEGYLPQPNSFSFHITVEGLKSNFYNLTIANQETSINRKLKSVSNDHVKISIDKNILLTLQFADDKEKLIGFIQFGGLMYHISLQKTGDNQFTGSWNPLMVDHLQSQSIFLSVENNEDGTLSAYPFFGDQRFSGVWSVDFRKKGDTIFFRDFKTGMKFRGRLLKDHIQLDILLADVTIATTNLSRSETDWEFGTAHFQQNRNVNTPPQSNDGWITANIDEVGIKQASLVQMIDDINAKRLANTHSVLIAKGNKLVFEAYFDGYNADIPHDLRSASKSISSAMIGLAIDDKIIKGTAQKLYDCIPKEYQYTKDSLKSKISIQDLLTMSSGLDVDGMASEGNYQDSDNWLKTALEASMANEPGTYTDYGSANPFLLGVCLNECLKKPLEVYMDQKLLSSLGITNYIIQTEDTQTTPYFGGGMHLTSRDMLKFGQLYLNRGKWKGKQIISQSWVEESFQKHVRLEDVKDKNEYGYLWWHKTYIVDNEEIESIEARGAGGQYIFVIPKLEAVVAITSGNFRNGKLLQQPEKILEEYILPAIQD